MNKDLIAEEQLLTLIRQKDDEYEVQRQRMKVEMSAHRETKNSNRIVLWAKFLSAVKYVLILGVLLTAVYIVYGIQKNQYTMPATNLEEKVISLEQATPSVYTAKRVKPLAMVKSPVAKLPLVEEEIKELPKKLPEVNFKDLLDEQINVIGIITGGVPQAIVENRQTKQVFFLSVGESVGEAKLMSVVEKKVTFSFQGELIHIVP